MIKNELSLILFDFHNVLSKDQFYSTLNQSHPDEYKKITQILFGSAGHPLTSRWMRGEISYKEIHQFISQKVGLPANVLDGALIDSVKNMTLNELLFDFSQNIRTCGVKIVILTDNMDVFDEIYVPHVGLYEKFDGIFSSYSSRKLKMDNNAELIFEAISNMQSEPKNTLFIDDCFENGNILKKAGGFFYHYDRYMAGHEDFLKWFFENFKVPTIA